MLAQQGGTKTKQANPFVYHVNLERQTPLPIGQPVPTAPRGDLWPPPKLELPAMNANRGTTKTKPPKQIAKDAPLVNGAIKRN